MSIQAVLKNPIFFSVKVSPSGQPPANRQPPLAINHQPPTATNRHQPPPTATNRQPLFNAVSVVLCLARVLPMKRRTFVSVAVTNPPPFPPPPLRTAL